MWWHTASLLCQFYNANREKGKPAADPYKFHPFAKRPKTKGRAATPADLARLFGGKNHG